MHSIPEGTGYMLDEYDGQRFWSRVNFQGGTPYVGDKLATAHGECWLWTGGTDGNERYGRFRLADRDYVAHRIAFRDFGHRLTSDGVLDHLCRAPRCVNPAHLEVVTQAENVRRGMLGNKSHCRHDHALTPDNVYVQQRGDSSVKRCRTCLKASKRLTYERRRAREIAAQRV